MADAGSGQAPRRGQGARRKRQQPGRSRRVHFSLTEQEYAALDDAAGRTGRTASVSPVRVIADQGRASRTARAEPGPVRRTGPGMRTAFRSTRSAGR
jgi:hypothetical protein